MPVHSWIFDGRLVVRSLRRRPAYVFASVATLALVMAANAALFATINATLFRAIPFRPGEQTVSIYTLPPGPREARFRNPLSAVDLAIFRERFRTLREVSGFSAEDRVLTGGAEPEVVRAMAANASLFQLISDRPLMGRAFTQEEEEARAPVVVLGYGLWQRRFGGDPAALGRTLDIDGHPHVVVGVMPASFPPPALASALVVPLGITQKSRPDVTVNRTYIQTLARLAGGATLAQADAECRTLMNDVAREYPQSNLGWTGGVITFRESQYASFRAPLFALFAAMALLMLIASANIASLTLAHVSSRKGEIALRRAIGASAGDIARLIVIEIALLNFAGAAIGILAAWRVLPMLLAIDPAATRALGEVSIDWRVAGYAFLTAMIAAAAASLGPAIHAADSGLGGSSARMHGSRTGERWRSLLLAAQTALCLVLLVSGGLLLRALARSTAISPGFDPSHVLTAQIRLPAERYATAPARTLVMDQLLGRLRAIPGVLDASQTLNRFVPGQSFVTLIDIEGQPTPDGSAHTVQFRRVSPAYFSTMRIRLWRGRTFTNQDGPSSPLTAVVSRTLAETYWHGMDPIGRQVRRAGKWLTVVGVVDDVKDVDLLQEPEPALYLPWAQSSTTVSPIALVVRAAAKPRQIAGKVRSAVLSVDPAMPIDRIQPLETFLADSIAPQRFRASLLTVLAAIGLLLGAIGVAGVTARSVAERMGEFGVRLALGCEPPALWRSAVARQFRVVAIGCAVGLVLSLGAGRFLRYLLPEIGALDPFSLAGGAGVLLVSSVLAAAVPSARVMRVDPLQVLRRS